MMPGVRLVPGDPRGQRARWLGPVDDRESDQRDADDHGAGDDDRVIEFHGLHFGPEGLAPPWDGRRAVSPTRLDNRSTTNESRASTLARYDPSPQRHCEIHDDQHVDE